MKRFFCLIGGGSLITAFCCSHLPVTRQIQFVIVLASLFLLVCFLHQKWIKSHLPVSKTLLLFFLGSSMFTSGLFIAKEILCYLPVSEFSGTEQTVTARVTDIGLRSGNRYTYTLKAEQVADSNLSFSFLCYSTKSLGVDFADRITLTVSFFEQEETDFFHSSRYYKGENILLTGSADPYTEVLLEEQKPGFLLRCFSQIQKFRLSLYDRFCQYLPDESASVLGAMLLGLQEDIPYPLEQDYIDSGIIHLLAISGMHVLILSLFTEKLFGFLLRKLPVRREAYTAIGVIATVVLFLLLSGMQVSAVRSGIMMIVLQAGKLFYRKADPLNSLFLSGLVIVLQNVYAIMDIGFLMSFLSSLGILLLSKPMAEFAVKRFQIYSFAFRQFVESVSVSLSATIFLLPVFLSSFRSLCLIAPVTNLVGGVLITPILALGFPIALCSPFLPEKVLSLLFAAEEFLLAMLNETASLFSSLPLPSIGMDYREIDLAWICFFILGIGLFFVGKYFLFSKQKWILSLFLLLFLCLSAAFLKIYFNGKNSLEVYFVSDGTTANCILKSEGQVTVISPNDDDYIDEATCSFLRKKGLRSVDNLILLYPSFRSYEDTLNFIGSIPVTNIFYPEMNLDAEFTLSKYRNYGTNLFPIRDDLYEVRCGNDGNFSVLFDFTSGAVSLTVCYDQNELLFFGTANASRSSEAAVRCLRGSDFSKAEEQPESTVLLNPGKDSGRFPKQAYLHPVSFTFQRSNPSE